MSDPGTAVERDIKRLFMEGYGKRKIASELDVTPFLVHNTLHRAELQRSSGKKRATPGDTLSASNGYIRERVSPDWPYLKYMPGAGDSGRLWILQHRKVMADHLGRPLLPTETVHHLDGDRTNNDISNLQIRQGAHGIGAAFVCNCCGSRDVSPAAI